MHPNPNLVCSCAAVLLPALVNWSGIFGSYVKIQVMVMP